MMFITAKKAMKIMNVKSSFPGAKVAKNIMGNPKAMAGKFWYTMLSAAGVLNSPSISRKRMVPVDAVPVSMPYIIRNCSSVYSGNRVFATIRS